MLASNIVVRWEWIINCTATTPHKN